MLLINWEVISRLVIETRAGAIARVKLRVSAADARGDRARVFKFAKNLKITARVVSYPRAISAPVYLKRNKLTRVMKYLHRRRQWFPIPS